MDPWTLLVAIPKTDDLEMEAVCMRPYVAYLYVLWGE